MTTLSPVANRSRIETTLAAARAVMREPQRRELLFWWTLAFLVVTLCALIRGYMDNIGLPVHGAATEQALFGYLPTVWLQRQIYSLSPGVLSWAVLIVHASWFLVPWSIALLVSWKRPQRLGSFFLWWFALQFIVNLFFALFPLRPPWMASPEVIRVVTLHLSSRVPDNNSLAAMPSLHVALPLLLSLWLFRERWKMPALAMLAYSSLVAFEVVLSGEHYVVDVAGAVVVVGAVALMERVCYKPAFSRALGLQPNRHAAAQRSGGQIPGGRIPPGLTGRPGAIFAVAITLIVLVSVKAALDFLAV